MSEPPCTPSTSPTWGATGNCVVGPSSRWPGDMRSKLVFRGGVSLSHELGPPVEGSGCPDAPTVLLVVLLAVLFVGGLLGAAESPSVRRSRC